jgi:predicted RND superfamily exporter protein
MSGTKKGWLELLSRYVTEHRRGVLMLTLVVAVLFAVGTVRMQGEVKLEDLLPYEHPYLQIIARYAEVFGSGGGGVVICLKKNRGDIFDEEILTRVIRMTDEIALWEETYRVLTLSIGARTVKVAKAAAGGVIEAETLMWPEAPKTSEEIEELKRDIYSSPIIRGLVAADGEATLISTEFKLDVPYERIFERLMDLKEKYSDENATVQLAGFPVLMGWIYSYKVQIVLVMVVSVALMLLILVIIFQNFIGMAVPLSFGLISTAMGLGFIGWTGINFSPLLYVLAFLVAARMVSHSVQITHRYMEEYVETNDRALACQRTVRSMLLPNWAGVSTDAAGFFILILVKIPLMQQVAVFMTFWMLTVLLCGIVTPVLCSYMPLKKAAQAWVRKSRKMGLLDRLCVGLSSYAIGSGKYPVGGLVVAALVFCGWQAKGLNVGDPAPGSPLLWPEHAYNRAINKINHTFEISAESLVLYFEGKEAYSVYDPPVLRTFEAFDRHMRLRLPDIYKSSDSFGGLMKAVRMLMYEGDIVRYELPASRDDMRGLIGWSRANTDLYTFRRYFDEKMSMSQITVFFADHTSRNLLRIRDAAYDFFKKYPREIDAGEFVLAGGTIGMEIAVNEEMKRTHAAIDGMVLATIFVLCALFYRSFVAGLMLTLPLVLGNLTAFAYMGLNNIGLTINTLPVAAVGVGVGVDFAIYIYSRCVEEFPDKQKWGTSTEAERWAASIVAAVRTSGKAVVFTGLTMILPIMVWWFISDLKFQAQMGMFLAMILTTNVLLAISLHPLLLYLIRPKFVTRGKSDF